MFFKLYAIIYVMGEIGAFIGPLPYDKAECERRIEEIRLEIEAADVDNKYDITIQCERRMFQPNIENEYTLED